MHKFYCFKIILINIVFLHFDTQIIKSFSTPAQHLASTTKPLINVDSSVSRIEVIWATSEGEKCVGESIVPFGL